MSSHNTALKLRLQAIIDRAEAVGKKAGLPEEVVKARITAALVEACGSKRELNRLLKDVGGQPLPETLEDAISDVVKAAQARVQGLKQESTYKRQGAGTWKPDITDYAKHVAENPRVQKQIEDESARVAKTAETMRRVKKQIQNPTISDDPTGAR